MNQIVAIKIMIGIFLLCLTSSSALGQLDPLKMYDDFNTKKIGDCKKCIDPKKWIGDESGNGMAEIGRGIKSKRARLSMRSWGNGEDDGDTTPGRNRLIFRIDPASITGVCFTPRVKKFELNKCETNDEHSRVRIRYIGNAYDTDTDGDATHKGLVYVGFNFSRSTENDDNGTLKRNEFGASAWVEQCEDENCNTDAWSTYDNDNDPDLDFGSFKKNNKTEFCGAYDSDAHQFVFSAGDDVRIVNGPDNGLPEPKAEVHPDRVWKTIEIRSDVVNCGGGKISAFIEAEVDNIKVNRRP